MDFESFKGIQEGKTAAVLGGGPMLPDDIYSLPEDVVLIGVNHHTLLLPLDYIVFHDKPVWPYVKNHPALKITHHREFEGPDCVFAGLVPNFHFSGAKAIWIADFMGFEKTYVCGIDDYAFGRRYWHSPVNEEMQPCRGSVNLKLWSIIKAALKHPERVEFVSGPLKEEWKCL